MKRSAHYKTRQREAILNYIVSLNGGHATAAQIVEYFENEDVLIGRTTIYRHLEKLTESGVIRRYTIDGVTGACYQYIEDSKYCVEHFHLKCEECGELIHLSCDMVNEVRQHIFDEHTFQVNPMKTVFYGKCETCLSII